MISEWYEAKIIASVLGTNDVTGLMVALEGVNAAFKAFEAGFARSDYIRDFTLALDQFTGSAQKTGQALDFFRQKARETRDDAMDLGKVFRDILPLSKERGFSQEAVEEVTVMLSKLATMYGTTLSQMESAYRRLLAGGRTTVGGTNPLMSILGITPAEIKEMNFDQLISKMQEAVKNFDEFGQSGASAFSKIKKAWEDAFGEGLNVGMGGRDPYNKLVESMTSASSTSLFHQLGEFIGRAIKSGIIDAMAQTDMSAWVGDEKSQVIATGRYGVAHVPPPESIQQYFSPQYAGNQALKRLGISSVTGYGGTFSQFGSQLGQDLLSNPAKQAEIMAYLKDEVHGGAIAWTDYGSSVKAAIEGIDMPKLKGVPDELINQAMAAKRLKEFLDAVDESAKKAYDSLFKTKHGYSTGGGLPEVQTPFQHSLDPLWSQALSGKMPDGTVPFDQVQRMFPGGPRMLLMVDPQINQKTLEAARNAADAMAKRLKDADIFQDAKYDLASAMSYAFREGWRGFVGSLSGDASRNAEAGIGKLLNTLFGTTDKDGNAIPGIFGAGGQKIMSQRVMPGLEGLATGYGAGQSGQAGARGAADVEGALAGFAAGGPIGAVIGAIGAVIGGYLGAQAKRADYQYAMFGIGQGGEAFDYGGMTRNITPNQLKQMTSQVQATFDTFYNGFQSLVIKLGQGPLALAEVEGGSKIQDRASGHFMEHFQQWLAEGMPKDLEEHFLPMMKSGYQAMGLTADRFDELQQRLSKEDPKAALQTWTDLADALINFSKAGKIFGATGYAPMSGNVIRGPWAQRDALGEQMRTSFLGDLNINDDQIRELQKELNNLVGPQQIAAAKQLSELVLQKGKAEQDAVKQLITLSQGMFRAFADQTNVYKVMGMVKADGTPDNEAVANFWKSQAEAELGGLRNLTNPADIQAAQSRFFSDVNSATAVMQAMGVSPQMISEWAIKSLATGSTSFQNRINEIGAKLSSEADKFWQSVQPDLEKFKGAVSTVGSGITGVGDDLGNIREPIQRVTGDLWELSAAVQAASAAVDGSKTSAAISGSRRAQY